MENTPLLIVEIALGLGFLVNITLAIMDLLEANRLNAKGKLKGAIPAISPTGKCFTVA